MGMLLQRRELCKRVGAGVDLALADVVLIRAETSTSSIYLTPARALHNVSEKEHAPLLKYLF